ncbi:MAG TPA: hypothetical protein GXZ87_06195 [Bacteroidales bacterium]|nr:hypothetical protein [Bacteroidales bacterium]
MAKKKTLKPSTNRDYTRKHRCTFMLNDKEYASLECYMKKYNIKNKSKLIRDILMFEVIKRQADDSPTLFD